MATLDRRHLLPVAIAAAGLPLGLAATGGMTLGARNDARGDKTHRDKPTRKGAKRQGGRKRSNNSHKRRNKRPRTPRPIVDLPSLTIEPPPPPPHVWSFDDPVPILTALAEKHTHGWVDNGLSVDELEARLAAGQRIVVTCSVIAELGVRALTRANIQARFVGSITRNAYDYVSDGHCLLEVHARDGWHVFDLGSNRQAIDADGNGISIVQLCQGRPRHWRMLCDDLPLYVLDPRYEPWILAWAADIEAWYDHILGVPVVHSDGKWWFRDDSERHRLEPMGYRYASEALWLELIAD
jgi:hypothetical protein